MLFLPAVRRAIHEVDPNLPISNVTALEAQVGRSIANQRLVAQLSTFFGLLAVFLSCIGIYGLMSCDGEMRSAFVWPWERNVIST